MRRPDLLGQSRHSKARRVLVGAALLSGAGAGAFVASGQWGGNAEATGLPTVAQQMSVFTSPPLPDSEVPAVVQAALAHHNESGRGAIMPGQARRLAHNLGINGVGIFALPTTGGHVCIVVSEATAGSTCVDRFDGRTGNVQWLNYSGTGVPQTIAGIAADAAVDVQVIVNGQPRTAPLTRNSFYWQATPDIAREDIEALHVRQRDGEVVTVDIGR